MNLQFGEQYDKLLENYGQIKEVKYKRFPRGLKNRLSEEFIKSLQQEFKRLTSPVIQEDEDGNEVTTRPDPKKVMLEMQKALPFLVR